MNNPVTEWFGASFDELHPMLQELHRHGGELTGTVNLEFGLGISGKIGRKLAVKLGLPSKSGVHDFKVVISHKERSLYWSRQFNLKIEDRDQIDFWQELCSTLKQNEYAIRNLMTQNV